MREVQIRERRADERAACVAGLAEVHAADGYPMNWPADPADWLTPPDTLGAWTAVRDGAVVGHVVLRAGFDDLDPLLAEAGDVADVAPDRLASVARLFVVPAARRLGLGAALIRHVTTEAAARDLRLALDVVDDGRGAAQALYESAGWRRVTTVKAAWTTPDGTHPLVHYYLSPPPAQVER